VKEHRNRLMVTTPEVVAEERFLLSWVKDTGKPLAPNYQMHDLRLNEEQWAAVQHVLTSRDRVIGIVGKAGTGKTLLMHEAIRGLHSQKIPVLVMTPNAEHAYERLRDDGFKDAVTTELFLRNPDLREKYRDGLLWIDESGLLSSRMLNRLPDFSVE